MTWKEQQRALTERSKMARQWHPSLIKSNAVLTTAGGDAYQVEWNGSFRRVQGWADKEKLLKYVNRPLPSPAEIQPGVHIKYQDIV